jgi:hypothetical protein
MNLALIRDGHGLNGQASSYRIELPNGYCALLAVASNRGWDLSIQNDKGKVTGRGLFGSTHDAIMLLEAEYYLLSDFVDEQIDERFYQALVGSNRSRHR